MREYKEKQKQIFAAVLSLAAQGIDLSAVRMQEIATEAGIGKGTLYEYFPSKEVLLAATVDYCLDSEIQLLAPRLSACTGYEQLTEVLIDYAAELITQRLAAYGMLGLVLGSDVHNFPDQDHLSEPAEAFRRLCDLAFRLAQADGLAGKLDYGLFQHVLLSNMLGYCSSMLRYIKRGTLTPDTLKQLQDRARWLFRTAVA